MLLLGDGSLGVRGKTGVVHGDDVGGGIEGFGQELGGDGGLLGAEVEGLETAVGEPAVEGAGDGTDGVLEVGERVVDGGGVVGDDTHEDILELVRKAVRWGGRWGSAYRVTVDVLGDRVEDNIGTVVERGLDVGGEEGVIHNHQRAELVCDVRDRADVHERERGVAGGLNPDQLRVRVLLEQIAELALDVVCEGGGDVVCGGDLSEGAVGTTVDIGNGDNVRVRGESLEDNRDSGQAGGEGEGVRRILKGGDGMLEVVAVGVQGARVLVDADGVANGGLCVCGGKGDLRDLVSELSQ